MSIIHLDADTVEEKLGLHRRRAYMLICRSELETDPGPSLREAKREIRKASGETWGSTREALLAFSSLRPGEGRRYASLLCLMLGMDRAALNEIDAFLRGQEA